MSTGPEVIGHRGASGRALENTLEAFRLARTQGADGIELDIHATRDHRFVVHHDDALPGLGPIPDLAWSVVAEVRLANGERPPLLEEVLVEAGRMKVYVEVKQLPPAADGTLLSLLAHGPGPAKYAVHGFDHDIISRLTTLEPLLPAGLLVERLPPDPASLLGARGATTLWPRHDVNSAGLVAAVHAAGGRVITWTVNTDADLARAFATGVDGVCTNHPDRARALLEEAA